MNKLLNTLKRKKAILSGHFLLSSGLHSPNYIQCALALSDTKLASKLGKALAAKWTQERPQIIISPAMGGLIIGHEVASAMKLPFFFTERENGEMTLRRGFKIKRGMKAIIVEDVFTTGKSTMETARVIEQRGGKVIGALSIVNRMGDRDLPFKNFSLVKIDVKTYEADKCPLCKKKVPLVKPGSRDTIGKKI